MEEAISHGTCPEKRLWVIVTAADGASCWGAGVGVRGLSVAVVNVVSRCEGRREL